MFPNVEAVQAPEGARLVLRGEVTAPMADELHRAALGLLEGDVDVVVECGQVSQLDFSALQLLLALGKELQGRGKSFSARGLSEDVARQVGLAGVCADLSVSG